MNKETQRLLAVISVMIAAFIILLLLLSGFDLSGIEIRRGIRFG